LRQRFLVDSGPPGKKIRFINPASEKPIYTSRRTPASLWQEYRIFPDRLELQSWLLFHTLVIPADEILSAEARPSIFAGTKGCIWGVKLDNCNFCRHVLIRKKKGLFKRIGFTPDNPEEFTRICKGIMPNQMSGPA
jgi:hypothetical protein